MREVACLLVTDGMGKVLIMSRDKVHWTFPQIEMRPGESAVEALGRFLGGNLEFDFEAEGIYPEGGTGRVFRSHKGEETLYHLRTIAMVPDSLKNLIESEEAPHFVWTYETSLFNLNAYTRTVLSEYGF